MWKYVLQRLIWFIVILFAVMSLLFITSTIMMDIYRGRGLVDFNDAYPPAISDYFKFIKGIVTDWDWGKIRRGIPVWEEFTDKFPVSMKINLIAFFIYVPVGIFLGVISAVKKNKITDKIISTLTLVFSSIPSFLMIFLLIMIFGYYTRLLPPRFTFTGYFGPGAIYVIPVVALSTEPIANITRLLRGELIENFDSDYLLLLKVKGLSRRSILFRHFLGNCIVPVLPAIMMSFIYVLTNSFFIEMVYNIQGLANAFFDALLITGPFGTFRPLIDIEILTLIAGFYTGVSLLFSLIIDVSYGLIDPRIRIGSKK